MENSTDILRKFFGYSSFRPGQEAIVESALAGRDSLVLMPTGGGKSICYQVPALILPGTAIVVSPLIALMNDQVQALVANGICAAAVHSNQDETANRDALNLAARGKLKILYISPERLMADISRIASFIKVSLVAIDEAHCISQWGHDFRPVYTELKAIKETWPTVPVMALTATADRLTRSDIASALGLDNPFCWIGSFDRPNISLSVVPDPGKKRRLAMIANLIDSSPLDSGIVYCLSRKKTEDMHESLLKMGYRSVCYHAGMPAAEREKAQRLFVGGDVQVVCATIAFGMGIDKSNIRWVVHNNIPGNIESYYQEIGRAGRDGMPAKALMFYNFSDIITRRSFVEESGQREFNIEKLAFMQRYAEATVCRRRILLSYFSEEMKCDCGNCDNCRYPRKRFDATVLAQKALSAAIRINCAEGINTIIDILRGSSNSTIIQRRYNLVKTYGAGRDTGTREWYNYIMQMIQLGLFEVAYEDNFHLRPTPYGMKVVRGEERIELAAFDPSSYFSPYSGRKAQTVAPKPVYASPEEELMALLKETRTGMARMEGIPPHNVFSDASLQEMVEKKPADIVAFSMVSGVSGIKLVKYGKKFVGVLRKFMRLPGSWPAGSSQKETLVLFRSGCTPAEIASMKGIQVSTVYSHFCALAKEDLFSDFRALLSEEDFRTVVRVMASGVENPIGILEDKYGISHDFWRLAMAEKDYRERHNQNI